jgi:hypothetical protein
VAVGLGREPHDAALVVLESGPGLVRLVSLGLPPLPGGGTPPLVDHQ